MSYLRVNETKLKKKDFHVFHRKNDQITVECPECIEFRINWKLAAHLQDHM